MKGFALFVVFFLLLAVGARWQMAAVKAERMQQVAGRASNGGTVLADRDIASGFTPVSLKKP